jgi:hypothetical protein
MLRISTAIAFATLIASGLTNSSASADSWGCSSEKCLQACVKASGKNCSGYCDKALRDKLTSKICK